MGGILNDLVSQILGPSTPETKAERLAREEIAEAVKDCERFPSRPDNVDPFGSSDDLSVGKEPNFGLIFLGLLMMLLGVISCVVLVLLFMR